MSDDCQHNWSGFPGGYCLKCGMMWDDYWTDDAEMDAQEEYDAYMREEAVKRVNAQLYVALLLLIAFMAGWVTRAVIWWWLF